MIALLSPQITFTNGLLVRVKQHNYIACGEQPAVLSGISRFECHDKQPIVIRSFAPAHRKDERANICKPAILSRQYQPYLVATG